MTIRLQEQASFATVLANLSSSVCSAKQRTRTIVAENGTHLLRIRGNLFCSSQWSTYQRYDRMIESDRRGKEEKKSKQKRSSSASNSISFMRMFAPFAPATNCGTCQSRAWRVARAPASLEKSSRDSHSGASKLFCYASILHIPIYHPIP